MRHVDQNTITKTFLNYCSDSTDARLKFILERFATHLHDFAKEVNLTHAEWGKAIELLTKAGAISTDERNEFILFSDVLGLSSLVDMINSPPQTTQSSVLGPFHILGAPELPVGGDLQQDNPGTTLIVRGNVTNTAGEPLAGAALEIWQTADNGLYSNQDPEQSRYNFRARMIAGEGGYYAFSTVRPSPYTVPDDGPAGELLHATGRHAWRPSHLHVIVTAPGHQRLVTELFPDDDPYLDEDAVFGVRDDLVMHFQRHDDSAELPSGLAAAERIRPPFLTVDFDFCLAAE